MALGIGMSAYIVSDETRSRKLAVTASHLPAATGFFFKMETSMVFRSKTHLQDFLNGLSQMLCILLANWYGHAATQVLLSWPVTCKIISNCKIDGIHPGV